MSACEATVLRDLEKHETQGQRGKERLTKPGRVEDTVQELSAIRLLVSVSMKNILCLKINF